MVNLHLIEEELNATGNVSDPPSRIRNFQCHPKQKKPKMITKGSIMDHIHAAKTIMDRLTKSSRA